MQYRLDPRQEEQFLHEGFVKIDNAFDRQVAEHARTLLWQKSGCDPADPATWDRPVIRIGDCSEEPFRIAASTPMLHQAFNRLVGPGGGYPEKVLEVSLFDFPILMIPATRDGTSMRVFRRMIRPHRISNGASMWSLAGAHY